MDGRDRQAYELENTNNQGTLAPSSRELNLHTIIITWLLNLSKAKCRTFTCFQIIEAQFGQEQLFNPFY